MGFFKERHAQSWSMKNAQHKRSVCDLTYSLFNKKYAVLRAGESERERARKGSLREVVSASSSTTCTLLYAHTPALAI